MRRVICGAFMLLGVHSAFASSSDGKITSVMTWDKLTSGDPWTGKFGFQLQKTDGSVVKLWAWAENKEFLANLLSAKTTGQTVQVDWHDSQDVIGDRKHAYQIVMN
jgi:hypothetical protein